MAEPIIDAKEEKFRKDSQWLSFKSATWGALGMASFFAALGTLASGLISVAAGVAPEVAGGMITPSAYLLGGAMPYVAMGALLALGALATYMGQKDATELGSMRDRHQAEEQAKCMAQAKSRGVAQEQEYEQNCRSDGKSWVEARAANHNQPALAAGR